MQMTPQIVCTYKLTTLFHTLLKSISFSSVSWEGAPPHLSLTSSPGRGSIPDPSFDLLLLQVQREGQQPTAPRTHKTVTITTANHFMMHISIKQQLKRWHAAKYKSNHIFRNHYNNVNDLTHKSLKTNIQVGFCHEWCQLSHNSLDTVLFSSNFIKINNSETIHKCNPTFVKF